MFGGGSGLNAMTFARTVTSTSKVAAMRTAPAVVGYCTRAPKFFDLDVAKSTVLCEPHDDLDPDGRRARLDQAMVCGWQAAVGDEEDLGSVAALEGVGEMHRFGGGGPLVEERGVRHCEDREIAHHRLEIQESLKASLRSPPGTGCTACTNRGFAG